MITAFTKIFTIGTDYIRDIFNEDVEVSEKIDGCFTYDSMVTLANGSKVTIGKIVNNKMKVNVLSLSDNGIIESKPITGWFKNGVADKWLKVNIHGSHGNDYTIKCTPEHKILTKRGWICAKNLLQEEDNAARQSVYTSQIQRQVLFGTLLGDSCISGKRFSCGHSVKQKEYVDLKFDILRSIGLRKDIRISGYGSQMHRILSRITPLTKDLASICCIDGNKNINGDWLSEITPLSLAFWYMDDGSLSLGDKQKGYVILHTNGFSEGEVVLLSEYLLKNYAIESSVHYSKGYYISLSTKSTDRFFSLIFPFIPPTMQYKLYEKYRTGTSVWNNFDFDETNNCIEWFPIRSIESFIPINKTKYDIEVADNHNYLINGFIVHNSQFVFGKINGELHIRSKGAQLYIANPEKMFAQAIDYIEQIQDRLPEGIVFYSEYMNKPKHNTLKYERVPKNNIMLFGVMHISQRFELNIADYADMLDIECVPIMHIGKVENISELTSFLDRESILGGTKIEGIVVKNYLRKFLLGGTPMPLMAGKYVSETFKEVHRERWGKEEKTKGRLETFMESFRTEARWEKAIQHLQERGEIENEPRDIGKLIKEIHIDIEAEEIDAIKEFLYKEFKNELRRKASAGVAEWYKKRLAEEAFVEKL